MSIGVNYILYDEDGRIYASGSCPEGETDNVYVEPGHSVMITESTVHFATNWVDNGEIKSKDPLSATWDTLDIVADGVEVATLSGLPIPCTVYVDGTAYQVDDGTFEFSANNAGDYFIRIREPGFNEEGWIVDAN